VGSSASRTVGMTFAPEAVGEAQLVGSIVGEEGQDRVARRQVLETPGGAGEMSQEASVGGEVLHTCRRNGGRGRGDGRGESWGDGRGKSWGEGWGKGGAGWGEGWFPWVQQSNVAGSGSAASIF
jgi:hypothetical protein